MVKNCFFLSAFFFAAVSGSPVWADRIADVCTDVDEEKRPELTAARLDALEAAGKAALMSIPENGYDPVAVTMEAMLTPEGLSEWISDATALRPYRGSLRGAKGVLGDRQGNSLDRSLLLTELLTFAGYDARLARARMSGSDLDVLRSKVGKAARLPDFHDVPEEHVRTIGRDERESSVQETACAIALATRIEEQTYQMLRVLAAAGITMTNRTLVDHALSDHWWVQYNDAGTWRDLDPTGLAATAEWTGTAKELPEGLLHEVSITVVIQVDKDGGSQEVPLLQVQGAAADFADGALTLFFEPKGVSKGDPAKLDAWVNSLASATRWSPVLEYRDQSWGGRIFGFDGSITDYAPGLAGQARSTAATAGGLLSGISGGRGSGSAKKAGAGNVTAMWIDYRVIVPGEDDVRERRTLFNLAEQPVRAEKLDHRAAALLGQYEIYVTSADPAGVAMYAHWMRETLALIAGLRALPDMPKKGKPTDIQAMINLVPRPSPAALYALMSGRADMNSESLAGLYTRPNIFSFWTRQSPDGKRMTTGFDIVRNDAPAGLDLEAAIRLGVADTVLEGLLLGGLGVESGNASAIFAGNQAAWRVVLSEKDLARAAPPKGIAGLVRTELARGYAIILPGSLTDRLPIAYWRVDPRTGTTLGMTAAGTGGTFSEYGKITNDIAFKVMGMATCLHLVHKFMFGPQTPGYVEAFSVFGCLTPSTKLMQAIAKRNKMTKALSKYYKSKAFRKEVRAYDKIVDGLKKATDEGRASEFIKKLSKTDSKIFDKFQRSKELDFDNVSLLKQFSEKFDPYFSPVKDLFLNIAKNFR